MYSIFIYTRADFSAMDKGSGKAHRSLAAKGIQGNSFIG